MNKRVFTLALFLLAGVSLAFGQANGKLQIHFMNVGQGDGAVLISPTGEVVLFDHGVLNECDGPVSYLQELGITQVDYLVTSHYHADHIGCTPQILEQFPLQREAIDRGGSYTTATYRRYVSAVGKQRVTAKPGMTLLLGEPPNWVSITVLAVNADGMETTDENSLSLLAEVRHGGFVAAIGGDLTGARIGDAIDVESVVAPRVGPVDVYKAHHHCSRYSSNENWLGITTPTVAILSMGEGNPYRHPHPECLERLHNVGSVTYWTTLGNGPEPQEGLDVAAETIIVETEVPEEGCQTFTVRLYSQDPDTYYVRQKCGGAWGESRKADQQQPTASNDPIESHGNTH